MLVCEHACKEKQDKPIVETLELIPKLGWLQMATQPTMLVVMLCALLLIPHPASADCAPRPVRPEEEVEDTGASSKPETNVFCHGYGQCCNKKADGRVQAEANTLFRDGSLDPSCAFVWSQAECAATCALDNSCTICDTVCTKIAHLCATAPVKIDPHGRGVPCAYSTDTVCQTLSALSSYLNTSACNTLGLQCTSEALCPSQQRELYSSHRTSAAAAPSSSPAAAPSSKTAPERQQDETSIERNLRRSTHARNGASPVPSGAPRQRTLKTLASVFVLLGIVVGIARLVQMLRSNAHSIEGMGILAPFISRRLNERARASVKGGRGRYRHSLKSDGG